VTNGITGEGVESEDRPRPRVLESPVLDHRGGAAQSSARRLLRGLEDELHGPVELPAHRGEGLRGAHQHRDVRVVAARVHDAHLLPVDLRADARAEGEVDLLGDGQGVHVRAEGDDRPRAPAVQHADDAVTADARTHFDAKPAEMCSDELRRARLLERKLGVLMDVAAPGDDLGIKVWALCGEGCGMGDEGCDKQRS
jgi:hypothetical protein